MKTLTTSLLAGLLLAGISAHADPLVTYNFAGNSDAGSGIDPNATISASLGIGDNGNEFGTAGTSHGWSTFGTYTNTAPAAAVKPTRYVRSSVLTLSAGDAISSNDYFTFSINPNSGYVADLTTFTFDYAMTPTTQAVSQNGSETANFFLQSDASGSFANVGSEASVTKADPASSTINFSRASISLSGSEFQNIASGETVEFRLYLYGDFVGDTANSGVLRLDNLTLNGTVTPEPSTFALLLAGLVALGMVRRRRA